MRHQKSWLIHMHNALSRNRIVVFMLQEINISYYSGTRTCACPRSTIYTKLRGQAQGTAPTRRGFAHLIRERKREQSALPSVRY